MISGYNFSGTVEIKLVDKTTGEVKFRKAINAYCINGARCTINALTNLQTAYPITRVILFDANKNPIKILTGSWGNYNETSNQVSAKFSVVDNSDAQYTFRYLTLDRNYPETPVYSAGYFANDQGTNITKTNLQALIVEWTIVTTFQSPP